MSSRFSYELKIQKRFSDFDMFKHVNNTVYPQYVEAARIGYFQGFLAVDVTQFLAITTQFEIEYVKSAEFTDEVSVLIRTKSLGNTSIILDYEIVNTKDRSVVYARGSVRQIACEARTGRPIRVPDQTRHLIVSKEGFPVGEAHFEVTKAS